MKKAWMAFALLGVALSGDHAFPQDSAPSMEARPSPGSFGPNAFYWVWHVKDARITEDRIQIDVSYRRTRDIWQNWTQAGVLRVEVPFSRFASLEFQTLVEKWQLNEAGIRAYEASSQSGTTLGDVIAGVRFNLLRENSILPEVALKGTIKSASASAENRRFTDTAGYEIGLLLAKDILRTSGALKQFRMLADFGFIAWDDGIESQNDALRYGVAGQMRFGRTTSLTVGWQGFTGWRKNGDRPSSLYIEAQKDFRSRWSGFSSVDVGLNRSTTPVLLSAGVRLQLLRRYDRR